MGLGRQNQTIALDWMYDTFRNAPVLGSLLDPAKSAAGRVVQWADLERLLESALLLERTDEREAAAVVVHGLAKAASMLADQYDWVVTNVPYLAWGKQSELLREFSERHYPEAKSDLATVFLSRCLDFVQRRLDKTMLGGTVSLVLPQNWLFLTRYRRFREQLLTRDTWHLVARLGEGGFDSSAAAGAFVAMICLSSGNVPRESNNRLLRESSRHRIRGLDVSTRKMPAEKARELPAAPILEIFQTDQLKSPDARLTLQKESATSSLSDFAEGLVGIQTADDPRYVRAIWEVKPGGAWEFMLASPDRTGPDFVGLSWVLLWEGGRGALSRQHNTALRGLDSVGRPGIAIHRMRALQAYRYVAGFFHQNPAVVFPKNPQHLAAVWCFCSSPEYNEAVRRIDQKLNVTNATLVKVPFDLDHWIQVAAERYPHGLPQPFTDDPTQWIFHGHPCGSVVWDEETKWTTHGRLRNDEAVLQVAVARLLGYRWPAELDPAMELAGEQREWVHRCEGLLQLTDKDGIVCVPPVRGEARAEERLLSLLAAAYGDAWSGDTLSRLLASADHAGKSLESWLRDKFFAQHCKLFQQRPFIWQIWDGLRDGFSVLVNYHKLDRKNLETLIYTYLGDWIRSQRDDVARGVDGAQERLDAAEALQRRLEQILEGEAPYDIFVRWKPIEEQPIGWNPDLNDGVRLNIRPFLTVDDVGRKGAGILRDKPNIHWKKDRGKDVESAPWFHRFKGERINDYHLTLAEKRRARAAKG